MHRHNRITDQSGDDKRPNQNYFIAGNYADRSTILAAMQYLNEHGYPTSRIKYIKPDQILDNAVSDKACTSRGLRNIPKTLCFFGAISVMLFFIFFHFDNVIWQSGLMTLFIAGMVLYTVLHLRKRYKKSMFEKFIADYIRQDYWTLLILADEPKQARFALRLVARTPCKKAIIHGPSIV
jgi:hypothetical protein